METEYFVILTCQNGMMAPMLNEKEELAVFTLFETASDTANSNILGRHFGYEIFERGAGVHQG